MNYEFLPASALCRSHVGWNGVIPNIQYEVLVMLDASFSLLVGYRIRSTQPTRQTH